MIARFALPLAAALAWLAAPASAQDAPLDAQPVLEAPDEAVNALPPPELAPPAPVEAVPVEAAPPPEAATAEAPPPPESAAATPAASQPAPEIAAAATPPPVQPTLVAEGPTAERALPPSPFSPEQRNGWLGQCRIAFLQRGASLYGGAGQPDACEMQLLQFERSYVPSADGAPPVILVRVPITRTPAAVAPDAADASVDGDLE
jgi:hypothetical protein